MAEIHATDYVTSPIDAAIVLADEWCRQKAESIDLWSCDFVGQEFFEAFLERTKQKNCLEEACQIKWYFPCETASFDKPLREQSSEWIKSFMSRNT